MIHIIYLVIIGLMIVFLPKSPVKYVKSERAPTQAACETQDLVTKDAAKNTVKPILADPPTSPSRPVLENQINLSGIFAQLPKEHLFDPKIVIERTHVNLADYTQKEILNENDYTVTYRLSAPNGHSIEQTIEKSDGKVSYERWKDERGGEVRRGYYQFGVEDKYIDKDGNGFEVTQNFDGSYTIARHSNKGLSESYGYDKEGNVTGVFVYRRESQE